MAKNLLGFFGLVIASFSKRSKLVAITGSIFFYAYFLLFHEALAQVSIPIPREGFPYCQPFQGNGPFDYTILGGEIRIPTGLPENQTPNTIIKPYSANPTGQSLQLTPNEYWHSGYAIVDIPFSSQFGIKTSFEYFSYGPADPRGNADGISFFMFDADQPLSLGYLGGSLAYAPYIDLDGSILQPGISGGYVGIGFDEWGNFGVGTVGQPFANWDPRISNSITVRGPEILNYNVYERYVTKKVNAFGIDYFPPPPLDTNPTKWFDIDHDSGIRTTDCLLPGYRKVYIELTPKSSGVGYNIEITMLVNTTANGQQLVSFPPIDYPFEAPERLKIGFAGSTGFGRNNHEIRNVTVNVSDSQLLNEPKVYDQSILTCIGDQDIEKEFKVDLATSDAFVTCLQLFSNKETLVPPVNSLPPTDYLACGLDGTLCQSKCNVNYYEAPAYDLNGNLAGTVYAELKDLNTGNFDQERDVVNIRFDPVPGFSGEASVFYNVTDNYGLTSDYAKITFTANPFPVKIQDASIENPSCDGQQDGRIYDLIVGDLVAGFDYEWLYNGASIGKSGATVSPLVNGEATFILEGINLGTYTLNVWNPSDALSGGCYETISVEVTQENGTPVELQVPNQTICEGEDVSFVPQIDPSYIPAGAIPTFLWYQNANRSGGALINGSTISVGGNTVTVSIASNGELTLEGLKNTGGTSTFQFFVEVAAQTQIGGNFCPFLGDVLTVATVKVNPPIEFKVSHSDDWCLSYVGEIIGTVTGASDVTYYLLDENDNPIGTNTSGVFSNLPAGNYQIYGSSVTLGCSTPVEPVTVNGPSEGLVITPGSVGNAFCNLPNGIIDFTVTGGNMPYQSVKVNGAIIPNTADGKYVVNSLAEGTYAIEVVDSQGCNTSISMVVPGDEPSNFTTIGSEVCEGQIGTASLNIQDPSTGSPIFEWYYKDASGNYQLISNGLSVGDVSYQINQNFELSVSGLSASPNPYLYYLLVSGNRICDQGYIPTEIKITPGPEMNTPIVKEACYAEANGSIQAQIPGNNYNDFEFSLAGDNGFFQDYSKNSGVFENLPAGIYELSIKSALGCVTTLEGVEVLEPSENINLINQTIERASCGLANGTIKDIQLAGGWGGFTAEWRKGTIDGPIVSGDLTGANNLEPDTYYLLVTDSKGCTETFDFEVGELSDPIYEVVPPIDVCLDERVEIRPIHLAPDPSLPPAAFTEVFWYKNPGQQGLISNGPDNNIAGVVYTIDDSDWLNPRLLIDGLPAGEYVYYFYVGCTGQEIKVDVEVFAEPEVVLETSPVSCFGSSDGKVRIASGSDPDYLFSINSASPVTQADFESLEFAAGTYNLEVSTPAGCPQILEFTIDGPTSALEVLPLSGLDPGCGALNGKLETTISGGWSPYQVTVIKNGVIQQTIEVLDNSLTMEGLGAGIYSLQIEDSEGCQIVSSELELVDGPSQIIVNDQSICEGQQAVFIPSLDPVATGATFEWYFDANASQKIPSSSTPNGQGITYQINPTTGELIITGLGQSNIPYKYYVLAVGGGVCPGFIAEAEVMVYGNPSATYVKTDEVCFESGGTIEVLATGGSGKYTFVLDGQISQDHGVFTNVPKGMHSIQITTPETCQIILNGIEILGPDSPLAGEISEIINPSCEMNNGSITLSLTGGLPEYSVSVIKDGVLQSTLTGNQSGQVVVSGIGRGSYIFEITDDFGCTFSLTEPLDLVEIPTEISIDDQQLCEGEDALLVPKVPSDVNAPIFTWYLDEEMNIPIKSEAVNGVSYEINASGELTISGLTSRAQAYSYYVMVEGPGICGVTPKKVNVTVTSFPNLRVSNPSIVCDPEGTVDLTNYIEGYNPSIYEYNIISPLGNALASNEVGAVTVSGNYEVSASIKGSDCWTQSQRILVRIAEEKIQSNFQYHADQGGGIIISNQDIQILEKVDFEDFSTGEVIMWEWDFGDGTTSTEQNPTHIYGKKGSYTVSLKTTDSIGCQSIYTIVVVAKDDYLLMMPNAFTPEGTKNQYYKPMHRGLSQLEFYVFSTWGELIYHANSLEDQGWDGTLNGKPAPNGNYVYKVKYQTRSGNIFEEGGVFILIR